MPDRYSGRPTAKQTAIVSPCIRNCCLDEQDVCMGCFRTVDEICAWGACDDAGKHQILRNAARRKQQRMST